jgi:DNA-binding response OmpR family regulator
MNSDKKNRILLVDDEQDITFAFRIGLEDNGFIIDTFNDPQEHYQISKRVYMIYYLLM